MKTRKIKIRKQKGGFFSEEDKTRIRAKSNSNQQIVHCISQLKRFAPCLKTNELRSYQFFYNLGRLQELLGETLYPKIWWSPIEALIQTKNYDNIAGHVDKLQELIGVSYDDGLISKGC